MDYDLCMKWVQEIVAEWESGLDTAGSALRRTGEIVAANPVEDADDVEECSECGADLDGDGVAGLCGYCAVRQSADEEGTGDGI